MRKFFQGFRYAFEGILALFRTQRNARFHLAATILVLIASWYFQINTTEWLFVLTSIGMVLAAEAFNSSIEFLADAFTKDHNNLIKKTKDIGAAGVLISALTAAVIGLMIFLPKVF